MIPNTVDIMNRGMECLTEKLGVVEAEHFISILIREKFDYTKWQRQYFDTMAPGEFNQKSTRICPETSVHRECGKTIKSRPFLKKCQQRQRNPFNPSTCHVLRVEGFLRLYGQNSPEMQILEILFCYAQNSELLSCPENTSPDMAETGEYSSFPSITVHSQNRHRIGQTIKKCNNLIFCEAI